MKKWQLSAVIINDKKNKELHDKYLSDVSVINGGEEVEEEIIIAALIECSIEYYTTSDDHLWLMPHQTLNYMVKDEIKMSKPLSALEAYKKYGGDAITEVIDTGSCDLNNIRKK